MKIRKRNLYLVFGTILGLVVLFMADNEFGFINNFSQGTILVLAVEKIFGCLILVTLLHVTRKSLMDYDRDGDYRELLKSARSTPDGAGLAAISVSLKMIAYAIVISAGLFSLS